jgi:Ring finger domain
VGSRSIKRAWITQPSVVNMSLCTAFLKSKKNALCSFKGISECGGMLYCRRHYTIAVSKADKFFKPDTKTSCGEDCKDCSICLDAIDSLPQKTLLCGHTFHAECLKQWYVKGTNDSCPMCRFKFEIYEKVHEDPFVLTKQSLQKAILKLGLTYTLLEPIVRRAAVEIGMLTTVKACNEVVVPLRAEMLRVVHQEAAEP